MSDRIVTLVPLRGGSKTITNKNTRMLGGIPLCGWVLKAAKACRLIDEVYVSTECPTIAAVVESLELGVKVIERPPELASDSATTESVMKHFASVTDFDILITMQATSPFTTAADLESALSQFQADSLDSLLTGVRSKRFYWKPDGTPLNYDPLNRPLRQQFDGSIVENGAFYISRRELLETAECRLGGKIGIYEMSPETATELDEPEDWEIVESLLSTRERRNDRIDQISLVLVDIDGTMTDGGMYYSADGEELKRFDTRDARGLHRLMEAGIQVVFVTSEPSQIALARAKKLGIPCQIGVQDKVVEAAQLSRTYGVPLCKTAFIGDDLNDLGVMQQVGFAACPTDARPEIRRVAQYAAKASGGHGAVREICDYLLQSRSVISRKPVAPLQFNPTPQTRAAG